MRTCPTCGKTILFGGMSKGDKRYCSKACYESDPVNEMDDGSSTPKISSVDKIVLWLGLILFFIPVTLWVIYNNLFEPDPSYTGPIFPKFIVIGVIVLIGIVAILAILILAYSWLMGSGGAKVSKREAHFSKNLDFWKPVRQIRWRGGVLITQFRYNGMKIGCFDHGSCHLYLNNGKSYNFSAWGPIKVENPILPEKSAEIAAIYDEHRVEVDNEDEATSSFYGYDGTIAHYKSLRSEVVAHSETPYDTPAERLITCGNKQYKVLYGKHSKCVFTDFRSDSRLGQIRELFLWGRASFDTPIPLSEGIFLILLTILDGGQCHPHRDV
jgi:hypothetical protein